MSCPCGGKSFEICCSPYIRGEKIAETAEALMRSRYSAYATGAVEYIKETTSPEGQKDFDMDAAKQWALESEWKGFEIINQARGTAGDEDGVIEFIATYRVKGQVESHHEISTFKKLDGKWFFMDGQIVTQVVNREQKVGRNEPCPCGSGKKFKKCCNK